MIVLRARDLWLLALFKRAALIGFSLALNRRVIGLLSKKAILRLGSLSRLKMAMEREREIYVSFTPCHCCSSLGNCCIKLSLRLKDGQNDVLACEWTSRPIKGRMTSHHHETSYVNYRMFFNDAFSDFLIIFDKFWSLLAIGFYFFCCFYSQFFSKLHSQLRPTLFTVRRQGRPWTPWTPLVQLP